MKDCFKQEVNVGDYILCSPNWHTQARRYVLAKVLKIAEHRVQIDLKRMKYSSGQPIWVEIFVKVPEDYAKANYEASLNDSLMEVGYRNFCRVES